MSALRDLHWDVFVTPGIPTVTSDLPPGTTQQMWSPIASTLIYGKRDAGLDHRIGHFRPLRMRDSVLERFVPSVLSYFCLSP